MELNLILNVVQNMKSVVSIKVIVILTMNVVVPLSVVKIIVRPLFHQMQTAVKILVQVISLYCYWKLFKWNYKLSVWIRIKRGSLFQIKFAMALDIHMTTLRNVVEQRDYVASTKVIVIMMRIVLVTLSVGKIIVHHPSDPMLIVV